MGKFTDNQKKNWDKAVELLKKIIEEKLDGDINKLKEFSFWSINGDHEYGQGYGAPDGDRTNIAYAIDFLLYSKEIPEMKIYGYTKDFSNYSGETLNTFNTLFSTKKTTRDYISKIWNNRYGDGCFEKDIVSDNVINTNDFYHVYQRMGNFTLLPCLTICGGSINTWKGLSNEIRDYMYPFMKLLKSVYEKLDETIDKNDELYELSLLMKKNEFIFKNDKTKSFDNFVSTFMLDGWEDLKLSDYLKCSELSEKNINITKEYVEKATKFINERTDKIINKLKTSLEV